MFADVPLLSPVVLKSSSLFPTGPSITEDYKNHPQRWKYVS